jgi:hypothetical protein
MRTICTENPESMNALPLETASEAIPTSTTSPKYHIAVKVEEEAATAIQNDADTEVDDEVPKNNSVSIDKLLLKSS